MLERRRGVARKPTVARDNLKLGRSIEESQLDRNVNNNGRLVYIILPTDYTIRQRWAMQ
jgi:hypothetical protein